MQPQLDCADSTRWLSVLALEKGCGVTPSEMLKRLSDENIEGRHLWKPMNMQPVFAVADFVSTHEHAVCNDLFERCVCLPSDTKMSTADIDRVCEVIRGMFEK